jgi:hypothetical protein
VLTGPLKFFFNSNFSLSSAAEGDKKTLKEAAEKKADAAAAIDEAGKKSAEAKADLEKNMKAAVEESAKTA